MRLSLQLLLFTGYARVDRSTRGGPQTSESQASLQPPLLAWTHNHPGRRRLHHPHPGTHSTHLPISVAWTPYASMSRSMAVAAIDITSSRSLQNPSSIWPSPSVYFPGTPSEASRSDWGTWVGGRGRGEGGQWSRQSALWAVLLPAAACCCARLPRPHKQRMHGPSCHTPRRVGSRGTSPVSPRPLGPYRLAADQRGSRRLACRARYSLTSAANACEE